MRASFGAKHTAQPPRLTQSPGWIYSGVVLLGFVAWIGVSKVCDRHSTLQAVCGVVATYLLADLVSAVYHFFMDNYGDGDTPVVGDQVVMFKEHHKSPWRVTQKRYHKYVVGQAFFSTNVACLLWLATTPWSSGVADVCAATFCAAIPLSHQIHRWSHMKRSRLPPLAKGLQDTGIIVSRDEHVAHHKDGDKSYAIVNGLANRALDANEGAFWKWLKNFVKFVTGVQPNA